MSALPTTMQIRCQLNRISAFLREDRPSGSNNKAAPRRDAPPRNAHSKMSIGQRVDNRHGCRCTCNAKQCTSSRKASISSLAPRTPPLDNRRVHPFCLAHPQKASTHLQGASSATASSVSMSNHPSPWHLQERCVEVHYRTMCHKAKHQNQIHYQRITARNDSQHLKKLGQHTTPTRRRCDNHHTDAAAHLLLGRQSACKHGGAARRGSVLVFGVHFAHSPQRFPSQAKNVCLRYLGSHTFSRLTHAV